MANIMQKIKQDPITILLQIGGVVIILLNLWLGSKLTPLAKNIDEIVIRVSAIEERNETVDPLVTRFIQLEERDNHLIEDLKEVKEDVKDLKRALNIK